MSHHMVAISPSRPASDVQSPREDPSVEDAICRVQPEEQKKIWIDLDNSPHVPFFLPIIEELQKRGHKVFVTARDTYQVCELLDFYHISCRVIGRHWGKNRALKVFGTCLRAAQLLLLVMKEKPDLAVSHGSRALQLASFALGIPHVLIFDYEYTSKFGLTYPDWIFMPELIPDSSEINAKKQVKRYPGLKEDVYVPRLRPDPALRSKLGLSETDLVVTVRPPATEAHYHNPEGEVLLDAALDYLTRQSDVRVILLPRNNRQANSLQRVWRKWISRRKILIPEHVVDGLNLIWVSDLVISGGGTMNREAAALGVPVYSIFRGRIGAVDKYLVSKGRLVLLENVEDIRTKIVLERRGQSQREPTLHSAALQVISQGIISIAEHQCLPKQR